MNVIERPEYACASCEWDTDKGTTDLEVPGPEYDSWEDFLEAHSWCCPECDMPITGSSSENTIEHRELAERYRQLKEATANLRECIVLEEYTSLSDGEPVRVYKCEGFIDDAVEAVDKLL